MLSFQCHACGEKIKAAEMMAGKGMRCPKCRQVVRVPQEPRLGQHEHFAEHGVAEPPPGPKLVELAERQAYRPATSSTDEGEELHFLPDVPPPLRKPPAPATEAEAKTPAGSPSVTPPPDDDLDEFKLQPLAPPPLRKQPRPLPRPGAVEAEIIDDAVGKTDAGRQVSPTSGPPPLKKTPPPLPKKSS